MDITMGWVILIGFLAILFSAVLLIRKDVLNLGLIVKQVTSGRWILTVTAGACLLIAVAADAWIAVKYAAANPAVELPFPVSTIFSIMTGVFTFYFLKENSTSGKSPEIKPTEVDSDVTAK